MIFALITSIAAAGNFAAQVSQGKQIWYGPATVSTTFPTTGNPFSADENDVRAIFTKGKLKLERLAYFAHNRWHVKLKATEQGTYRVRFLLNGKPIGKATTLTLNSTERLPGVKRVGNRFVTTKGEQYVPFGHNFAWRGW